MLKLTLDGEKITSKKELFETIGQQLVLPSWFGKNLDALYDVITCDILPKDALTIEITGAAALKENLGGYADALIGMLGELAEEDKRMTVVIG